MEKKELIKELNEASKSINLEPSKEFNILSQKAEKEFYNSINSYVKHEKYQEIIKYLDLVLDSKKINGFVLEGSFGTGKSLVIKSHLKAKNRQFIYFNSYTTSLAFYMMIYENKDNIILIDDLSGIWNDEKGISILRALMNTDDKRFIRYESTSDKLKCPSSFNFNGKIIILCNNITKHLDESVLSRTIYRKIEFTNAEKLEFSKKIIKWNYPKLSNYQVSNIYNFVNENVDETNLKFNFRDLLKITEIYLKYPKEWKDLAIKELEKDETMILIKELQEFKNKKYQVEKFIEQTGLSRRTYYNYLKRYNLCKSASKNLCCTKK